MYEIINYIKKIESKENINVLIKDLTNDEIILDYKGDNIFVSASLIKIPIMLAVLNEVYKNNISLDTNITINPKDVLEDNEVFKKNIYNYTLEELITWMIIQSDNTSTNVLIKKVGFQTINKYIKKLELTNTKLERYMNDWNAIKNGKNNFTSLNDMYKCFSYIIQKNILNDELCNFAINTLYKQEINNQIPKYISDVKFAHKTGGLDYLNSDVGIFKYNGLIFFLGISLYNIPKKEGDRESVANLSKLIYEFIVDNVNNGKEIDYELYNKIV